MYSNPIDLAHKTESKSIKNIGKKLHLNISIGEKKGKTKLIPHFH